MFSNRAQFGKKKKNKKLYLRCFFCFVSQWPILATFASVFLQDFPVLGNATLSPQQ